MKKFLSVFCSISILFSVCFTACAEDEAVNSTTDNIPKVVLNVSEPDEDGIFTADLILYNATYKGIIATLGYDKNVVVPVDYETKEPTTEFDKFAVNPTVAKNPETDEDITDWQLFKGSSISDTEIKMIYVLNTKCVYPNSVITKNFQALANEKGLTVSSFAFKKISKDNVNFKLVDNKLSANGFMLINGNGLQNCSVTVNYPVSVGETVTYNIDGTVKTIKSDDSATDDETAEKRVKARTNGTIILQIDNYATVSDSVLKWIDKENKSVMPYIKDDYTMVPLRFISEELNCKVSYEPNEKKITINTVKTELVFTIDSTEYTDDGLKKTMDTAPVIKENRTFIPLRTVAEALNRSVTWIDSDKSIVITSKEYPWDENNSIEKELYSRAKSLMSPMIRDMAY